MTNFFVGNNIVGNFHPQEKITKEIENYKVDKIDGSLRLQSDKTCK